jgi:hypothetical protein
MAKSPAKRSAASTPSKRLRLGNDGTEEQRTPVLQKAGDDQQAEAQAPKSLPFERIIHLMDLPLSRLQSGVNSRTVSPAGVESILNSIEERGWDVSSALTVMLPHEESVHIDTALGSPSKELAVRLIHAAQVVEVGKFKLTIVDGE